MSRAAPVTSMPESITVRVGPTGDLTATLYSCASWGNSPETMTAQLLAEEFDVDPHSVTVTYAGTRNGLPATGPGGSRLTVMLAGAVEGAAVRIKDKARIVAEHMLEASADDLEWVDGGFQVKGSPDSRASLGDIAIQTHLFKHRCPRRSSRGWRPPRSMTTRSRRCHRPTARTSASSTRSWATPATSRSSRSTSRPAT